MEQAAGSAGRDARNPAEIEAEIERTRVQLAGTIDEIVDRVHPKRLAQRGVERIKDRFVDADGRPRKGPLVVTAAGAAALIALAVWRHRR